MRAHRRGELGSAQSIFPSGGQRMEREVREAVKERAEEMHKATLLLPFCHITLREKKPVSREKYPDFLRT